MITTADVTKAAKKCRVLTTIVLALAGSIAGCGGEKPAYGVGEGAPDTSGYELAYSESGGPAEIGQATTRVEPWGFGCHQLFIGGRSGTAALLQQPCGENRQVFAVTGDFWDLYRSAGDVALVKYGLPVGRRGAWKQGWTQGFGRGGVFTTFFMQLPGGRPHVLTVPMLEYYLSFEDRDTRFGYPTAEMSLRGNRLCQQFEHAVVTATGVGDHFAFDVSPTGGITSDSRCS